MKYALYALALIAAPAWADHPQKHYEPNVPANYADAAAQLKSANEGALAAQEKADLRTMHELSYDMEAALEVMSAQLAQIAEQVEVMHKASERGQKAKADEALAQFSPSIKALPTP